MDIVNQWLISSISLRYLEIGFESYYEANDKTRNEKYSFLFSMLTKYLHNEKDLKSLQENGLIAFFRPSITVQKDLLRMLRRMKSEGEKISINCEVDYTTLGYNKEYLKSRKKTKKKFCFILHLQKIFPINVHDITLHDIYMKFIYPPTFHYLFKIRKKIKSNDDDELYEFDMCIKTIEKKLLSHYKPFITKYHLRYNEPSYAADVTFDRLYPLKDTFSKEMYEEMAQMIPDNQFNKELYEFTVKRYPTLFPNKTYEEMIQILNDKGYDCHVCYTLRYSFK